MTASWSSSLLSRDREKASFSTSESPRLRIRAIDVALSIPSDELRGHTIVAKLVAAATAHCKAAQALEPRLCSQATLVASAQKYCSLRYGRLLDCD